MSYSIRRAFHSLLQWGWQTLSYSFSKLTLVSVPGNWCIVKLWKTINSKTDCCGAYLKMEEGPCFVWVPDLIIESLDGHVLVLTLQLIHTVTLMGLPDVVARLVCTIHLIPPHIPSSSPKLSCGRVVKLITMVETESPPSATDAANDASTPSTSSITCWVQCTSCYIGRPEVQGKCLVSHILLIIWTLFLDWHSVYAWMCPRGSATKEFHKSCLTFK